MKVNQELEINETTPLKIIFWINETKITHNLRAKMLSTTKVYMFEHWRQKAKSLEKRNMELKLEYFLDNGNVFNEFHIQKNQKNMYI